MISSRTNELELRARAFGARGRYGWRCWITDMVPSDCPTTILESADEYPSYTGALVAACRFLWWLARQHKRPSSDFSESTAVTPPPFRRSSYSVEELEEESRPHALGVSEAQPRARLIETDRPRGAFPDLPPRSPSLVLVGAGARGCRPRAVKPRPRPAPLAPHVSR